jgi:hypothetical protein
MMDKTSMIFNNPIPKKVIKQANKSKKKALKKFGDDTNTDYKIGFKNIDALDFIGAQNIVFSDKNEEMPKNPLIVGNIRMGFGHYRISIAMASCAKALGFTPLWLDLASFDATGSKWIRSQNDLYSMGSRLSQKSKLFNHFYWEPLNSEGFRKITYNAKDQKNTELLVPIYKNIDKNIPYIATHVWPSQAAIHAGMNNVVNAIPDNWPMGLHLSEGSIHTVQTEFAYHGYKMLNGFDKKPLKPMPDNSLKIVGHYVDHELLVNLKKDNEKRINRLDKGEPIRLLLTVGGAGAGFDMFLSMIKHLKPYMDKKQVALFINFGDHKDVYDKMCAKLPWFNLGKTFFNEYDKLKNFVEESRNSRVEGLYSIYNKNIFEAVYSTNLLMPVSDLLVTKPSELVFYPIPKLFMRHIGGHEVYGAVNGQELGDSTFECPTIKGINEMFDRLLMDKEILVHMINEIERLKEQGYYNGAYECVKLAVGKK